MNESKSLKELRKALRALFRTIQHCEDPKMVKRLEKVYTELNEIGGDLLPDARRTKQHRKKQATTIRQFVSQVKDTVEGRNPSK